ncbi:transcriptional regulator [Acidisoma sp. 7E03]
MRLGQMLSERVLAEQFGVSKSPVREALAQLKSEGLVRIVPQRGAFVFTLSAEGVRQLCEFRRMLEQTALGLAAARAPQQLADRWAAIVEQMAEARMAGDRRRYLDADTAFHTTLFDLCGNRYMTEAYSLHLGKIASLRTHLAVKPRHTERSFQEHGAMAAAIARGDLATTLAILDEHIDRCQTSYDAGIMDTAQADTCEPRTRARGHRTPPRESREG